MLQCNIDEGDVVLCRDEIKWHKRVRGVRFAHVSNYLILNVKNTTAGKTVRCVMLLTRQNWVSATFRMRKSRNTAIRLLFRNSSG